VHGVEGGGPTNAKHPLVQTCLGILNTD
jgi:hypothetical protein